MPSFDYIIAGSGIAGLYTALLAEQHGSVLLITKGGINECNTQYAQGGIAAAIGKDDSVALHAADSVAAAAGLGDAHSIQILTAEAPDRIADLIRFGVPFDTLHGEIALGREGAHSMPRILHAGGDATGKHIELSLSGLAKHSAVKIREHSLLAEICVEHGSVCGARIFNARNGAVEEVQCNNLVLATGGCGQLYQLTTNPKVTTGDGPALAYRAGAEVMDMEFIQFHPTALRLKGAPAFLISEAVRGEGAILRTADGRRFMPEYASQAELAPRDVVARAIVAEMKKAGSDHVYLDVRHLPPSAVQARFPQIYRTCLEYGLDITTAPVPVAPAAHYMMGGVRVNSWGETNVPGLLATGEASCTGAHGANRLASNSLLETIVFSKRLVERTKLPPNERTPEPAERLEERHQMPERHVETQRHGKPTLPALKRLMWNDVGLERSGEALERAANTLAAWEEALPTPRSRGAYDLANAVLTSRLIAEAALARQESRGAHYRSDYPVPSEAWLKHLVYVK